MIGVILTILNIILWICGIAGIIVLVLAVASWLVRKFGGDIHVEVYDGGPEDGKYVGDAIITKDENGNTVIRMKEDVEQNKD